MRGLGPGSSVMLVCWLHVLALVVPAGPVYADDPLSPAQAEYHCVDNGGQVIAGQGTPPAWCREDTVPVPKALLDRPVSEKEVEEVERYLNQKLVDLAHLGESCRARHDSIDERKDDRLDALDERAENRRRGWVSRRERRVKRQVEESAEKDHLAARKCQQDAQRRIAEVNAILSSPEKLRAEVPAWRAAQFRQERALARERELAEVRRRAAAREAEEGRLAKERAAAQLSEEFRQQLHGLLENASGASEMLAAGSYDAFALRLRAITQQIQSIRVKYAVPFQNGEHNVLGTAVTEACSTLYAAEAEWKKERRAASDLASAQEAVDYMSRIGDPSQQSEEALKIAQQQSAQAKMRLAGSRESVTRLMAQAMKAARDDREQQVSRRASKR